MSKYMSQLFKSSTSIVSKRRNSLTARTWIQDLITCISIGCAQPSEKLWIRFTITIREINRWAHFWNHIESIILQYSRLLNTSIYFSKQWLRSQSVAWKAVKQKHGNMLLRKAGFGWRICHPEWRDVDEQKPSPQPIFVSLAVKVEFYAKTVHLTCIKKILWNG